jgi:hypothetical protein
MADSNGTWKNVPLADVANLIIEHTGLGFEINENIFTLSPVNGSALPQLSLIGFEAASTGASLIKGVSGTLEWSTASIDTLNSEVEDLKTSMGTMEEKLA